MYHDSDEITLLCQNNFQYQVLPLKNLSHQLYIRILMLKISEEEAACCYSESLHQK